MEKLNIAEILKDCPKGMELDCTIWDGVLFDHVDMNRNYPIYIRKKDGKREYLTEYGEFNCDLGAKCVIFPKGKSTWEGFQRPFKDGDVLIKDNNTLCIYKSIHKTYKNKSFIDFYCGYRPSDNQLVIKKFGDTHFGFISEAKLATEEEKQKLFKAIKDNGYRWNAETKTLEKLIEPKFKVGDRIKKKGDTRLITIKDVRDNYYIITFLDDFGHCFVTYKLSFSKQGDYELVPNKFDITTLKPFDKVLVRDTNGQVWTANLFSHVLDSIPRVPITFVCVSRCPNQCIPYESNEHLLGTSINCDDYYKTWE